MTLLRNDRGGSTAEFAIVIPVILLVVGIVLGGILLASTRVTLVSAAHDIARLEARGDTLLAASRAGELPSGSTVGRDVTGGILCVTVHSSPGRGPLSAITVSGQGCAAMTQGTP